MDGDEFDSSFPDDHISDTFTPDPSGGDDLHDAFVDGQSHDGHYDHHDGGHHEGHQHHHDDGSHHDGGHHGHHHHEDAPDDGAYHDGSTQDAGNRGGSQADPCAPPDPCAATHVDESPFSDVPTTNTGTAVPSTTAAADATPPETTTAATEPAPVTAPNPAPATTSPDTITIGGDIPDGFQGLLNDTPDPVMTELSRIDPNSPNAAAVAQMLGQVGMEQAAMAQTWTVPSGVGVDVNPTGTGLDYSSLDGEIFGTSTDAAEHNSDA